MVRHVQYVLRPFDLGTCTYGDPVTHTDEPCTSPCDTSAGPGIYLTTRMLDSGTCEWTDPVCTKLGPCGPGTTVVYDVSGTFDVPAGVTQITYKITGAGAGGPPGNFGGGGGGACVTGTLAVTPLTTETVTVGLGGGDPSNPTPQDGQDSWVRNNTTAMAKGGTHGGATLGGAGGSAAASIGTVKHSGGNGGNGSGTNYGGGGGGSGSPTANGGNGANATGSAPGAGGTGTGAGGVGSDVPHVIPGGNGNVPGGGGGGGTVNLGGDPEVIFTPVGAHGRVEISYGSDCT